MSGNGNTYLRGSSAGQGASSNGSLRSNSLRESTVINGTLSVGSEVDNQLRPYASDANDPSQKYLTSVRKGTTAYWNSQIGFIPADGEIIIYTDYQTITKISPITGEEITMPVPAIKIGTGNAYVQDLAFVDEWERDLLLSHIQDMQIHVSPQDRQRWDNKLNCENQITGETLILNRL